MKQGTFIIRAVMLLLFAAVAAYFGVSVWRGANQNFHTFATYAYTLDDASEATGLLVREEEVLQGQPLAVVDVLPNQGEKVGVGQTVAYLYRDESSLERTRELRALKLERQQLLSAMEGGGESWDSARLDESIVDAMIGLRGAAAYGDLTGLEEQTLTFKSLVLRRGYSTGEISRSMEDMLADIEARQTQLQAASAQDTVPIRVDKSGCFSAVTDGYEELIHPDMLQGLSVPQLEELISQKPEAPSGAVGKLITRSQWYFVAALPESTAGRLTKGETIRVRFSRDWSGEVPMKVERTGEPEDGQCLVVLSATRNLADTSLLRKQTVEIIFESTEGIRVPKNAVRSLPADFNGISGEQAPASSAGVYVLTGSQAELKEVKILADDGDFYLVSAVLPDTPTQQQQKTRFQAGDEVIISSEALFDGKVVLDP